MSYKSTSGGETYKVLVRVVRAYSKRKSIDREELGVRLVCLIFILVLAKFFRISSLFTCAILEAPRCFDQAL